MTAQDINESEAGVNKQRTERPSPHTPPQAAYRAAEPKQFGNLHERMKYAIAMLQDQHGVVSNDLWHAVWDLATEVKHYRPVEPPYGRR